MTRYHSLKSYSISQNHLSSIKLHGRKTVLSFLSSLKRKMDIKQEHKTFLEKKNTFFSHFSRD